MKVHCSQNPQHSSRTITNLPSIANINNYQEYEKQKKQRKDISKKRKQLQEMVLMLRRKAEQSNKKFQQTQSDLMCTYNKKLQTLDYTNKKKQFRKKQQEQLQKRKNFSSLARYLHSIKKQEALKQISSKNKQISKNIKQQIQHAQNQKSSQKQMYLRQLYERNRRMSQTSKNQAKWARQKSFQEKHKLSSRVRDELITIQSSRITKQNQTIRRLEEQKESILVLLQKNRQKHNQVQQMKQQIVGMDLYDFQASIKNKDQSRELKSHLSSRTSVKSKKKKEGLKYRASLYY